MLYVPSATPYNRMGYHILINHGSLRDSFSTLIRLTGLNPS